MSDQSADDLSPEIRTYPISLVQGARLCGEAHLITRNQELFGGRVFLASAELSDWTAKHSTRSQIPI